MTARSLVAFIVLPAYLLISGCTAQHPADEVLIKNFNAHKVEFNQLLQMYLSDKGLGRVAHDFTRPANPAEIGITPERIAEYRQRFHKLSLRAGIEGYDEKDTVWFYASTQGLAVSGSKKGYAYVTKKPELIVEKLDGYRSADGKSFSAFRHIEGNWYLFLDFED